MTCAWPSPFASRSAPQNASLRDPTEIIVDGWRPARHDHVETNGLGDPIGMSERARAPVPGLNNGVKTERYAMREQRLAAVAIEGDESVPQILGLAGQLPGPCTMPFVDGLGECSIIQPRRLLSESDALCVDLQAGIGAIAIEEF